MRKDRLVNDGECISEVGANKIWSFLLLWMGK